MKHGKHKRGSRSNFVPQVGLGAARGQLLSEHPVYVGGGTTITSHANSFYGNRQANISFTERANATLFILTIQWADMCKCPN